ncbi:MAG: hypothetical protein U0168_28100 [Nannocystaceae bacterium]
MSGATGLDRHRRRDGRLELQRRHRAAALACERAGALAPLGDGERQGLDGGAQHQLGLGIARADQPHLPVPTAQRHQLRDVLEVAPQAGFERVEEVGLARQRQARRRLRREHARADVLAQHLACRRDRAVLDAPRPDHAAGTAEEDPRLSLQHARDDVADQRRRGLVAGLPPRREVEVDEAAADLGVILARSAAGHQHVAEIDERSQRHPRQQDRLLEPHRVGRRGAFFEQRAGPDVGVGAQPRAFEQHRAVHEAAVDRAARGEHRVVHRRRTLDPDLGAGAEVGACALQARAGVQSRAGSDALGDDIGRDPRLPWIDDLHALCSQELEPTNDAVGHGALTPRLPRSRRRGHAPERTADAEAAVPFSPRLWHNCDRALDR